MKPYRKNIHNKHGLTLVETMVSLVVMSTILVSSWSMLTFLLGANQSALELTQATSVVQYKLEELLDEDFDLLASGSETIGIFSLSWTVTPVTGLDLKSVVLNAQWTSRTGRTRSTSAKTMTSKVN